MKLWLVIGIAASLLYGVSAVLFKLLSAERFLNGHPGWVLTGIGLGIALCGILGVLLWPASIPSGTSTMQACLWAIPAGLLNGFATLMVLWVMRSSDTNLSQLVPVYNTNTLVAFLLAVIFFKELPQGADLLRNAVGALLIVAGTIFIGIK
jgi:drug/metabolite transporter (DMT)-like permease